MDRRDFIKKTALTATGVGLSPLITGSYDSLFGQNAPSNRIKVGLIGCRNMGWSDLETFLKFPGVECVALCDIDDEYLYERAVNVEKIQKKKPKQLTKDWRHIIDNKDIDLVIVGTPDHWHCLQAVSACQAGKDVYVEKPLANTIEECDLMVNAARKYNRIVQVGQWQRSDPHWDEAASYIHSGALGRVRTVKAWAYQTSKWKLPVVPDSTPPEGVDYDMWLGPAPKRNFNQNRFHYNFRFFWDYAGGLMADWGVHLLDYALKGMNVGLPNSVYGAGGKYAYPDGAMETPDTLMITYKYDDFNIIWDHACGIAHGLFDKREGVAFYGENGTLVLTRQGWEVLPEDGVTSKNFPYCYPCDNKRTPAVPRMEPVPFKKGEGKGLYNHVANTLECMRTRQLPNADVAIAATVAKLSHMGNISCRVGDSLKWDDQAGKFDNAEANELIKANYRQPWKLPKL
ncbi:MAG: Gfo/Idh/MocA family protein [Fermentimonas sp.]|jgi:predicted dehydrogenase